VPGWMWSWWFWQWFGFVLIGAGLVVSAIVLLHRLQQGRPPTSPLVTGGTTTPAEINFAKIRIGGDLAGLLVVVGVILALMPALWGFYLGVTICSVLTAVVLFLWHRHRRA